MKINIKICELYFLQFLLVMNFFLFDQCFNYFIKSVMKSLELEIAMYFSTGWFNLFMIFNFNTKPSICFVFVLFYHFNSHELCLEKKTRGKELVLLCVYIFRLLTKYLQAKCYYYGLHDSHTMYVWNVHLIETIFEDCMQ